MQATNIACLSDCGSATTAEPKPRNTFLACSARRPHAPPTPPQPRNANKDAIDRSRNSQPINPAITWQSNPTASKQSINHPNGDHRVNPILRRKPETASARNPTLHHLSPRVAWRIPGKGNPDRITGGTRPQWGSACDGAMKIG
jgi:hypothetical protein